MPIFTYGFTLSTEDANQLTQEPFYHIDIKRSKDKVMFTHNSLIEHDPLTGREVTQQLNTKHTHALYLLYQKAKKYPSASELTYHIF